MKWKCCNIVGTTANGLYLVYFHIKICCFFSSLRSIFIIIYRLFFVFFSSFFIHSSFFDHFYSNIYILPEVQSLYSGYKNYGLYFYECTNFFFPNIALYKKTLRLLNVMKLKNIETKLFSSSKIMNLIRSVMLDSNNIARHVSVWIGYKRKKAKSFRANINTI